MVLGIYKDVSGREVVDLFGDWECFHRVTFSPDCVVLFCTDFTVKGGSYAEKQENARMLAIGFQSVFNNASVSWLDLCVISDCFYRLGRRYGLLTEFRENGIC